MVKNIIFDFGGVLLDLDYERTYSELGKLLGFEVSTENIPPQIYKLMLGYEKGEINTETFLWNLQREASHHTPQPNLLIKAWNAMLLGWNPKRFDFLTALRKDYTIYLLSNTNELHIDWVMRDLVKNHEIKDFDTRFFEQTFYSHKMKDRKPDLSIYHTVIKETGINPQESLFIDDNTDNVKGAIDAGLHAVLHDPKTEIIEQFAKYLKSFS